MCERIHCYGERRIDAESRSEMVGQQLRGLMLCYMNTEAVGLDGAAGSCIACLCTQEERANRGGALPPAECCLSVSTAK